MDSRHDTPFEEFAKQHGKGFSPQEMALLREYATMRSTLDEPSFDKWYAERLHKAAQDGAVKPGMHKIKAEAAVRFD